LRTRNSGDRIVSSSVLVSTMKRGAWILISGFLLLSHGAAELEVSFDDEKSPSLVKMARPSQEKEESGQRIAVALANQPGDPLSLMCKVDMATKKEPVNFMSTLSDGSPLQLDDTEEKHDFDGDLYYLRKEARIVQVKANMDDGTIKCDYNIPGGEGKSVKATLSIWKLTQTSTQKLCEADVDLELTFVETGEKSTGETNVIGEIKNKIKNLVGKTVNINLNTEFKTSLPCMEAKENAGLRNIEKTIMVGGETVSDQDFYKEPTPPLPTPSPTEEGSGLVWWEYLLIAFGVSGVVVIMAVIKRDWIRNKYM